MGSGKYGIIYTPKLIFAELAYFFIGNGYYLITKKVKIWDSNNF